MTSLPAFRRVRRSIDNQRVWYQWHASLAWLGVATEGTLSFSGLPPFPSFLVYSEIWWTLLSFLSLFYLSFLEASVLPAGFHPKKKKISSYSLFFPLPFFVPLCPPPAPLPPPLCREYILWLVASVGIAVVVCWAFLPHLQGSNSPDLSGSLIPLLCSHEPPPAHVLPGFAPTRHMCIVSGWAGLCVPCALSQSSDTQIGGVSLGYTKFVCVLCACVLLCLFDCVGVLVWLSFCASLLARFDSCVLCGTLCVRVCFA